MEVTTPGKQTMFKSTLGLSSKWPASRCAAGFLELTLFLVLLPVLKNKYLILNSFFSCLCFSLPHLEHVVLSCQEVKLVLLCILFIMRYPRLLTAILCKSSEPTPRPRLCGICDESQRCT